MTILVSNDDGVLAPGLRALVAEFQRDGEIVVSAPDGPRSAAGNSITLHKPLRTRQHKEGRVRWISVSGTPADAVKLAIREILDEPPSLVLSGINIGLNTGSNILYSGTVAAALEGALHGIPSFAFSTESTRRPDWRRAARTARRVVRWALGRFSPPGTVLNVNIPAAKRLKGFAVATQEPSPYLDVFEKRIDPRGRPYYWICGNPDVTYSLVATRNGRGDLPTDARACAMGYVSITPLSRDMTSPELIAELRRSALPRV